MVNTQRTPWQTWGEWTAVAHAILSGHPELAAWALPQLVTWSLTMQNEAMIEFTLSILQLAEMSGVLDVSSSSCDCVKSSPPVIGPVLTPGITSEAQMDWSYFTWLDIHPASVQAAALACVRLVNAVADAQQAAHSYAQSVTALAEACGLPRMLVDLRHAVTHAKMPADATVIAATRAGWAWVAQHYWHDQLVALGHVLASPAHIQHALNDMAAAIPACIPSTKKAPMPAIHVQPGWLVELQRASKLSDEPMPAALALPPVVRTDHVPVQPACASIATWAEANAHLISSVLVPQLLDGCSQPAELLGGSLCAMPSWIVSHLPARLRAAMPVYTAPLADAIPFTWPWTSDTPLIPAAAAAQNPQAAKILPANLAKRAVRQGWAWVVQLQIAQPQLVPALVQGIVARLAVEGALWQQALGSSYILASVRGAVLYAWLRALLSRAWHAQWYVSLTSASVQPVSDAAALPAWSVCHAAQPVNKGLCQADSERACFKTAEAAWAAAAGKDMIKGSAPLAALTPGLMQTLTTWPDAWLVMRSDAVAHEALARLHAWQGGPLLSGSPQLFDALVTACACGQHAAARAVCDALQYAGVCCGAVCGLAHGAGSEEAAGRSPAPAPAPAAAATAAMSLEAMEALLAGGPSSVVSAVSPSAAEEGVAAPQASPLAARNQLDLHACPACGGNLARSVPGAALALSSSVCRIGASPWVLAVGLPQVER